MTELEPLSFDGDAAAGLEGVEEVLEGWRWREEVFDGVLVLVFGGDNEGVDADGLGWGFAVGAEVLDGEAEFFDLGVGDFVAGEEAVEDDVGGGDDGDWADDVTPEAEAEEDGDDAEGEDHPFFGAAHVPMEGGVDGEDAEIVGEAAEEKDVDAVREGFVVSKFWRCASRVHGLFFSVLVATEGFDEEGVLEGDAFEEAVATGGAAVAGVEIDLEEKGVLIGFGGAEFCDPFGGFPVGDAGVVEAGEDEEGGVILGFDVVVGGVGADAVEGFEGGGGVAPFVVFAGGEGDGGVEHGVEDVDKGDVGDEGTEEVGLLVDDGSDEESTSAAAVAAEVFF